MATQNPELQKIKKGSDYSVEKARDKWRYKLGMSKKPSRLLNLQRTRSMPNISSQLQVARQPSRPAPSLPKTRGMFGGYLRDTIDRETGASQFVVWCVDAIETTGDNLKTDALYRASGNQAKVQEIVATSEHDMWGKLCKEDNVNVLTGALKLYFRQLQRPLMEYRDFNRALQTDDPVEETRLLVGGLPAAERKTLVFLMHHLQKVLEQEEANKMGVQGLSVVFGPTLMRLVPNSLDIGGDMKQQNAIIEFLLTECDSIFPISQLDSVDGSHKTATLDIARRRSESSDSDSDSEQKVKPAAGNLVKLRRNSDSSDSDEGKKRSDDSSDSDGSVRKRNLMTTIERNRQSGAFSQSGQQANNTTQQSGTDGGKNKAPGVEALYATVDKKRPSVIEHPQNNSSGKTKKPSVDSDDEAFDLPPPPPVPVDYPRVPVSRPGINVAYEDVKQYNIEAISYRRKSSSDSSDSDDHVKYRKRVTAENRAGMIEHLPPQNETITIVSNTPSGVHNHSYTHSISTISNQYKTPPSNPAPSPPVDSNFNLDTYLNRYKKPLSARQVGDEANKRISAVFRKAPERPDHNSDVPTTGKEAGTTQKSTPVDPKQRRNYSSTSSSSDSDSGDSQHGRIGHTVVSKPTAI